MIDAEGHLVMAEKNRKLAQTIGPDSPKYSLAIACATMHYTAAVAEMLSRVELPEKR